MVHKSDGYLFNLLPWRRQRVVVVEAVLSMSVTSRERSSLDQVQHRAGVVG